MMNSQIKNIIKYIVGIIILFACIYFTSKQVNIGEVTTVLKQIYIFPVLLSIPFILLSNLIRAYRWKILLRVIKPEIKVNNILGSIMVGHLLNSFSIKFGEIARPLVLAEHEKISKTSVLASVVIEGLADFLFLILSLAICLIFMTNEISTALNIDLAKFDINFIVYFALLALFLILLFVFRKEIREYFSEILPEKLRNNCERKIELFKIGMASVKDSKSIFLISIYTLLLWFAYAIVMYILFWSFDFQIEQTMTIYDALIIVIFAGIATALGFTPASVGVYHLIVASIIISLFSIESSQSYAYTTLTHFMNLLVQSAFGIYSYVRFSINLRTK